MTDCTHLQQPTRNKNASLIFVDHGVEVREAYCCNVMLLQLLLPAIHQTSREFFIFQKDSAPANTALTQPTF